MKKLLLAVAAVALLAAACNSTQPTSYETSPSPSSTQKTVPHTSGSRVDAAITKLNATVDSEDSVSTQPVDDIVNSDSSVINSYKGAANANY